MSSVIKSIDELGRIVVPKEIRKELLIRKDDKLEIRCIDDKIEITKVVGNDKLKELLSNYMEIFKNNLGINLEAVLKDEQVKVTGNLENKGIENALLNNEMSYFEEKGYKGVVPIYISSVCEGVLLSKSQNDVNYLKALRDILVSTLEI